jgi:hypothetical protein
MDDNYSQQFLARFRTCRRNASFTGEAAVFKRKACLCLEQVEKEPGLAIVHEFGFLLAGQFALLVSNGEFVHPFQIGGLESELQDGAGSGS